MKEKREIILDFTGCKYITEVHWKIRDTFLFPSFYGENLDALWDMGCDYIGSDEKVFEFAKIRGVDTLPKDIKEYFLDKVMNIFYEIAAFHKNVKFEIES